MRKLSVFLGALALAAVPARGSAEAVQLPNLVPLAARDVRIDRADGPDGPFRPLVLRFSTAIANRGEWALDLLGVPTDPAGETSTAYQCVAFVTPFVCAGREQVGRFVWHPAHGHHHLEGFALYELRRLQADGSPDLTESGLLSSSGKVSFCLIDVERDGSGLDVPFYRLCSAGHQGISAGWRDVYRYGLEGQQLAIQGVPDGEYAIVVTIDPDHRLSQTTRADDVSVQRIALRDGGTRAVAL